MSHWTTSVPIVYSSSVPRYFTGSNFASANVPSFLPKTSHPVFIFHRIVIANILFCRSYHLQCCYTQLSFFKTFDTSPNNPLCTPSGFTITNVCCSLYCLIMSGIFPQEDKSIGFSYIKISLICKVVFVHIPAQIPRKRACIILANMYTQTHMLLASGDFVCQRKRLRWNRLMVGQRTLTPFV